MTAAASHAPPSSTSPAHICWRHHQRVNHSQTSLRYPLAYLQPRLIRSHPPSFQDCLPPFATTAATATCATCLRHTRRYAHDQANATRSRTASSPNMNNSEKLGLIERVERASEEQAKRTLKSMILKCHIRQETIARAIKDAIERHTPTPTIVYQDPASGDDDEEVPTASRKKSKKKKHRDGSSQDEEDEPSPTSKRPWSTRRGDINADPLVGHLVLKKTKTKLKRNKKRSSDHNEEQNDPNSSKKIQPKHASNHRADPEQRTCDNSMGGPSQPESPTVIDLVTSSDGETCDTEHSDDKNLDDESSGNNSSDSESPYDFSSAEDRSDDRDSEIEQQDKVLPAGIRSSQKDSNNKVDQASAKNGDSGRGAFHSITISMAKASNQNEGNEMSPLSSVKKRKASDHTMEEIPNDQPAKSATGTHVNKRSKTNHPQELQTSQEERTCRKCGTLFPSMAQLHRHRHHCKGFAAKVGSDHRSEPPSVDRSGRLEQVQKTSNPASETFTDEPHNTLRLPSRPRQIRPAYRELPKSSDEESEEGVHQCKFCKRWFSDSENSDSICRHHSGMFGQPRI